MTTFTASEVRELANFLNTEQAVGAAELHAYADRLEADEKAQPVAVVKDSDALYTGWLSWTGEPAPPETKLYTHPAPSGAERLAEAVRNGLIDALRHQRQIDEDGAEVGVSRQAVDEAAAILSALAAHSAQAQPPAARVPDWTDAQCVAFMAVGLRHTEYKKGKSPTVEEIRQGAKAALAAQENPNG